MDRAVRLVLVVAAALGGLVVGFLVTDAVSGSDPRPVQPIDLDAGPEPGATTSTTPGADGPAELVPAPTIAPAAPSTTPPAPAPGPSSRPSPDPGPGGDDRARDDDRDDDSDDDDDRDGDDDDDDDGDDDDDDDD